MTDAFAEIVISEDQEFRILNGPVWTDPQNFAFSAADLKGGARKSDEIGVYITFAGKGGEPERIATTSRPLVCLSEDGGRLLFQSEARSGSIATAQVRAYDLSDQEMMEPDQVWARAQLLACLGVRKTVTTDRGCHETDLPLGDLGAVTLSAGSGCRAGVSVTGPDGMVSRLDHDWTLSERVSSPLGAHSYRLVATPGAGGAVLYPALSRAQKEDVWKRGGALPVISVRQSGQPDVVNLPWNNIFEQRFYQIAPMAEGWAIGISTHPDRPASDGGVWLFAEGQYRQIWQGNVEDMSLTASPDGRRLGFVSLPDRYRTGARIVHRIIVLQP
ncbi:hypothetical protein KBY29_21590 [Ruegeria pomeroyi]|nr:hypothetical protein [Ruegeria pomeroyi]